MRFWLPLLTAVYLTVVHGCSRPKTELPLPSGCIVSIQPGMGAQVMDADHHVVAPHDERGWGSIRKYVLGKRAFVGEYAGAGEDLFKTADVRYVVVTWDPEPGVIRHYTSLDQMASDWASQPWGMEPLVWRQCHIRFD